MIDGWPSFIVEQTPTHDFTQLASFATWKARLTNLNPACRTYFRSKHIAQVGFPIITVEALDLLVGALKGKRVIDVGCGIGFLARLLQKRGIDVTAVDNFSSKYLSGTFSDKTVCEVQTVDARTLDLSPYDAVIMTWPDYHNDLAESVALNMIEGQYLFYEGTSQYGCCATDGFFDVLDAAFEEKRDLTNTLNTYHLWFEDLFDQWTVYRKVRA